MLEEVPQDVIVDILSRLPCKCLAKFRCVSKQWNSIICSHNFTKLQFSRSTGDTSKLRILLRLNPFRSVNYDEFFESRREVIHEEYASPVLADVDNFNYARIIGECNGLICIMLLKKPYERSFLLWNPTIREWKEVRKNDVANLVDAGCMFDYDIESGNQYKLDLYGFGYDSSSDDYKILRLMVVGANPCTKVVNVEFYRVGSRIWRKIEHPVSDMTCIFPETVRVRLKLDNWAFLNGACYWVMSKFPTKDNVILRFNLGKEEVEEITLPPYLSNSEFLRDVMVIDGKLALLIKVNNAEIEIWIMNEYGAASLFTKKMTVPRELWCTLMSSTLPICFPKNGRVLMYDNSCRLFMQDPEKSWNVPSRTGFLSRHHLKVYAESLVSPYHLPNAELTLGEIA